MGRRKSYSRQSMQKFTHQGNVILPAGAADVLHDFDIPEEVVVKRCILTVVPVAAGGATGSGESGFFVAIVQNQSGNAATVDSVDPLKLVRHAGGSLNAPVNIDFTISMRKLAGSTVSAIITSIDLVNQTEVFFKFTIHYLEI